MQVRIERGWLGGFASALAFVALGARASAGVGHELLIAEYAGNDMRMMNWTNQGIFPLLASGQNGMQQPNGFTMGPDCRLYVASYLTSDIKIFRRNGTFDGSIPLPGSMRPADVVFGPRDGMMYVSAINDGMILRYDFCAHAWSDCFPSATSGRPAYMTFAANGDLVFSNYQNDTIMSWPYVSAPGTAAPVVELNTVMSGPENIALGPNGDLFIVSYHSDEVLRAAKAAVGWSAPTLFASVTSPHGLTFTPEGKLLVGNRSTGKLERYLINGTFDVAIGSGLDPAALLFASRAATRFLYDGEIVATQGPPVYMGGFPPGCDEQYVVKVMDPDVVPYANRGANTSAPMFSNQFASTPNNVWNLANLGPVFGVTVQRGGYPNIYVAASPAYGFPTGGWGPGGPGCVYKLDGVSGNISQFVVLPQASGAPSGLGDVEWDRYHNRLFVSNFEDGCIYAFDASGALKQKFDPWVLADANNDGIIPLDSGGRVWALRVYNKRILVFSVWVRDSSHRDTVPTSGCLQTNNCLYAVNIKTNGDLTGAPVLLRVMDPIANEVISGQTYGWSNPVSDIDVKDTQSPSGPVGHPMLLVAERGMSNDFGSPFLAGQARTMEVRFMSNWFRRFDIGDVFTGGWIAPWTYTYSAGGAAYDFALNVWASGDKLHDTGVDDFLFGLQRVPAVGNILDPTPTSKCMLIDLGDQTRFWWNAYELWQPGDVELCPFFTEPGKPH